ncbi:MAG TPA: inositol monophosphatase family protein [Candidatus Dormibacteraeota bacterium]|nr:inositol monophosphatase family protein [Candidatus Dormibacteraeota bacterium]
MGGHEDVDRGPAGLSHLALLLARSDVRALVAELGGRVVGYAELHARPSSLHDASEGWLGALAVAADLRGSGIGGALLRAVEREARLLGCADIALESSAWRDGAHRFYAGLGYEEAAPAKRFRRRLTAGSQPAVALAERFLFAAARAANAAVVAARWARATGGAIGGKQADATAEKAALEELLPLGLPVVAEEAGLLGAEPEPGAAWIALDPIDGTRNFRTGLPPWSVSIGLVRDGAPLAGLVLDAASGRRWWGGPGLGAWIDGRPAEPRRGAVLAMPSPTPRTPPPGLRAGWERVRVSGCTSVDLCQVADGSVGGFAGVDAGEIHPQDVAAAMAVVEAAGGRVLDAAGWRPVLVPDPSARLRIVAAPDADGAAGLLGPG